MFALHWAIGPFLQLLHPYRSPLSTEKPLVRGHAAWALGRVLAARQCHPDVRQLLENALGWERR